MADDITVTQAAEILRTSPQTVRNYLHQKVLRGRIDTKNKKWFVERASVQSFLAAHGPLDGGRRRKSRSTMLQAQVQELTTEVARLSRIIGLDDSEISAIISERDDLRARVVALEDALAQMRNAADLQRAADAERDEMVSQLLTALRSANRADGLRRQAVESLEGVVARSAMPGHADSMR